MSEAHRGPAAASASPSQTGTCCAALHSANSCHHDPTDRRIWQSSAPCLGLCSSAPCTPLCAVCSGPQSHDVYHQPGWTSSPPFPSTKARSSPPKVQRERWTPADPNRRVCTRFRSLAMVTHSVGFSAGGRLGGTFVPPFLPPSLFLATRLGWN